MTWLLIWQNKIMDSKVLITLIASTALVLTVYIYTQNTPYKQCLHAHSLSLGHKNFNETLKKSPDLAKKYIRNCNP